MRKLQDSTSVSFDDPVTTDEMTQNAFPDGASFMAVPYFPYLTHCEYYGAYMFNPTIFETHPDCSLVSLEDVIPISDFKFGMSPTADTCNNIVLRCLYSEDLQNLDSSKKYWFQAQKDDQLFQFYQDSITPDQLRTFLNGQVDISSEDVSRIYLVR